MPAGQYATMTYRDHAMRRTGRCRSGHVTTGIEFDRHEAPEGDAFACRYEAYLTDPKEEPRKTRCDVTLASNHRLRAPARARERGLEGGHQIAVRAPRRRTFPHPMSRHHPHRTMHGQACAHTLDQSHKLFSFN